MYRPGGSTGRRGEEELHVCGTQYALSLVYLNSYTLITNTGIYIYMVHTRVSSHTYTHVGRNSTKFPSWQTLWTVLFSYALQRETKNKIKKNK